MFFQKFFLYTIFLIFIFFLFYIFYDEFEVREEIDTPIYIEPIVIPSLVKEESDIEILEKLKDATRETFNNSNYYDDKVADEVLGILKEVVKNKNIKKDISFKYENRVKKELKKIKIASDKKKLEYKKRVKDKKRELEKRKSIVIEKRVEQSKIDRLSKENIEEDIKLEDLPLVETLGVVEISEPFTLN